MLDPRAIALQGVGFGAAPMALLGIAQIDSSIIVGGGGGSAKRKFPGATFDDEERIRAEIIREDEEILAVLMSAVTSGALEWLH